MRKEQVKTAGDAAQGCLGTIPNLQAGSSPGVRRKGGYLPWQFLLGVEVPLQINHKGCFQECRGELLLCGQHTKHWWFGGVLRAPAVKELAGVPWAGTAMSVWLGRQASKHLYRCCIIISQEAVLSLSIIPSSCCYDCCGCHGRLSFEDGSSPPPTKACAKFLHMLSTVTKYLVLERLHVLPQNQVSEPHLRLTGGLFWPVTQ